GDIRHGIYDPAGGWKELPSPMTRGRWYPSCVTLANGDALVVSGTYADGKYNTLPQVWEHAARRWRPLTSAQKLGPYYPFLHVAPDGRVFMAGPGRMTSYLDTSGKGRWTNVGDRVFPVKDTVNVEPVVKLGKPVSKPNLILPGYPRPIGTSRSYGSSVM